jgi:hypothetical protein
MGCAASTAAAAPAACDTAEQQLIAQLFVELEKKNKELENTTIQAELAELNAQIREARAWAKALDASHLGGFWAVIDCLDPDRGLLLRTAMEKLISLIAAAENIWADIGENEKLRAAPELTSIDACVASLIHIMDLHQGFCMNFDGGFTCHVVNTLKTSIPVMREVGKTLGGYYSAEYAPARAPARSRAPADSRAPSTWV